MVTTKAKAVPLPQKAKSIRLLLVDDHEVVRVGLRTLLSGVPTVLDRHGCEDGASRLRVGLLSLWSDAVGGAGEADAGAVDLQAFPSTTANIPDDPCSSV